jgi:hypothetical protein
MNIANQPVSYQTHVCAPSLTLNGNQVTPVSKESYASRMSEPKPRMGARGARKVKTGCQTCKYVSTRSKCKPALINQRYRIRHKKCDEARPACFQCSSTGRRCDLSQSKANQHTNSLNMAPERAPRMNLELLRPSPPYHMRNLTHAEASRFDYFRLVCARDFALCLESAPWENLLLHCVHHEPSIFHAALAIAALSRRYYSPIQIGYDPGNTRSAIEFSMVHYNLAIQTLNRRLDRSIGSSKLAVLASILFIHIEAFQEFQNNEGFPNLISAHLNGGLAIVHNLKSLCQHIDYLETALDHIRNQIEQFDRFSA